MILIGITGYKRSGKDTLATMLKGHQAELEPRKVCTFISMAFAEPIYDMMHALLYRNLNTRISDEDKDKELAGFDHLTPRRILQTLGTPWGRDMIDPDLWVRMVEKRIIGLKDLKSLPGYVVLTDVRFHNEVAMIRRLNGVVVKVANPRCTYDGHVSESYIHQIIPDLLVHNDGTMEEFNKNALTAYHSLESLRESRSIRWENTAF